MKRRELIREVTGIFEKETRLVELPSDGKVVFVGDTHGDLDASERVISRFLRGTNTLLFLGDYVDRGDFSRENLDALLQTKWKHPERIYLLAGNHEGYLPKPFSPANFWESLSDEEKEAYGLLFSKFPLAATSINGVIALHGGLPELDALEEVNEIEWGDDQWDRIVWGDFVERENEILGDWGGRIQFGQKYFDRMMERYKKRVLIRSHQPYAPLFMFKRRCVTILTSYAYVPDRHVAIVDLEKEVRTADDIILEKI
ncbi:MAG TPA: metallophosphoesterase [Thermodesulfobacteriota bacterium]|nr:metallophosphoesterase [Thermodesulfobacteriota bacterium]